MARILISDGDSRSALAATRSLVRDGHEVFVAAAQAWSLAGVSRGAHPTIVRASALLSPAAYAREMGMLAARAGIDVLLPVSDAAVEALLDHRELLPAHIRLPFPPIERFRLGTDKARVLALAQRAGFDVPASRLLNGAEDDVSDLPLPAFVKPHRSVVTDAQGRAEKLDVICVHSHEALRACLRDLPAAAFPVLVQEGIRGAGAGSFALRWDGETRAEFQHRRVREKPPAGGLSVCSEAVPLDREMAAATRALLTALEWQGVAMVECKVEHESGRRVFMELNGRLWGSLQLAIDAGVDFPALLVRCALGEAAASQASQASQASPPPYRTGLRSRWSWGDVDHLYARLTKTPDALQLVEPYPSRSSVLRSFVQSSFARGTRDDVGRWGDPWPFLLETGRRLAALGPRVAARLTARQTARAVPSTAAPTLRQPASPPVPAAAHQGHQRTVAPDVPD